MKNKYDSVCRACGTSVPAGAGFYTERGVCCQTCYENGAWKTMKRPEPKRLLTADGKVRTPYEKQNLPLVRSFPKARWDKASKCWAVSTADADLPRVIEIADRLELDVAPELRARSKKLTEQAKRVSADPRLRLFQVKGVDFLSRHSRCLLADEMGCIDGDAIVRINRAGKGFAIKLSALHRRFNGGPGYGKRWDLSIRTYIRSFCDGELRLNPVSRVLDKGIRPVVRITLASGKSLRLTPEHEVLTEGNVWRRADTLTLGVGVYTNGAPVCLLCGSKENVSTYPYAKFKGHCRNCIYRKLRAKPTYKNGRIRDKSGYILISGQWDHPNHNKQGQVREHVLVMEKKLGRFLKPGERIHHFDGDPSNNGPSNLQLVDDSRHAVIHGREGGYRRMDGGVTGKGGRICFIPKVDTVVSVEDDGEAHVYDVVCDDPHRNFVANGIVVHNCGKTVEALCALGPYWRVLVLCPASLKLNWLDECRTWVPRYESSVLEGRDGWRYPDEGEILIGNWEIMPEYLKADLWNLKRNKEKQVEALAIESAMGEIPEDLVVVVDEAHALKGKSYRSRAVRSLGQRAARVWGLTGTPMLNRPLDLWGILSNLGLVNEVFGGWNKFTKLFNGIKNKWGGWEFGTPEPEVPERLRRVMLRRLRSEVLPDLPDKTIKTITVEGNMSPILKRKMDTLWGTYEEDIKGKCELPPFEKFSEVRAHLAESRIKALDEIVDEYEESETPVVVFSAFRAPIFHLGMREAWGYVVGGMNPNKKKKFVEDFQAGKLKGIALTIEAGGVGLTLTQAHHVVFCDLDWTPALNQQAEDRVARIGQEANKIVITRLQSNHPLDIHVTELLAEKIALIDASIEAEVEVSLETPRRQECHIPKQEVEDLLTALKILSGMCDGALARDGQGFSGTDSRFGKSLATRKSLSDRQGEAAKRMLRKYHRQLPADLYRRLYPGNGREETNGKRPS